MALVTGGFFLVHPQKDDIRNVIPTAEPPTFPVRERTLQSVKLMIKHGRYGIRTSDLFRGKEASDHYGIIDLQGFQLG